MGDQSPQLFDDGGELPEVGEARTGRTFRPGRAPIDETGAVAAPRRSRRFRRAAERGGAAGQDGYDDTGAFANTPDDDGFEDEYDYRGPNFLIRRALAVGAVVAVIAVAGIVIGRMLSGDDGPGGRAVVEWDAVVLIDDRSIRLVEPGDGDQISSLTLPTSAQQIDYAFSGTTLATLDGGDLVIRDTLTGRQLSSVDVDSDWELSQLPGEVVVAGSTSGAGLSIIDRTIGEAFNIEDIAEFDEPRILLDAVLSNPAGTHLAAAETNTFQSALVDIANRTVVPFAGLIVALDDTTVVTAQRLGSQAEVEFHDLTKTRRDSVDVEAPNIVLITGESTGVTVADDGSVYRLNAAENQVQQTAQLGVDPNATVTAAAPPPIDLTFAWAVANGTRALVGTDDTTWLVDDNGQVLGEYDGELLSSFDPHLDCAVVGSRTRALGSAMLDLRTGETVTGMIGGAPTSTSFDGCTAVIGSGPTSAVYEYGQEVDIDLPAGTASVTPDGSGIVVAGRSGVTMHRFDDSNITTLAEGFATVAFLDRPTSE